MYIYKGLWYLPLLHFCVWCHVFGSCRTNRPASADGPAPVIGSRGGGRGSDWSAPAPGRWRCAWPSVTRSPWCWFCSPVPLCRPWGPGHSRGSPRTPDAAPGRSPSDKPPPPYKDSPRSRAFPGPGSWGPVCSPRSCRGGGGGRTRLCGSRSPGVGPVSDTPGPETHSARLDSGYSRVTVDRCRDPRGWGAGSLWGTSQSWPPKGECTRSKRCGCTWSLAGCPAPHDTIHIASPPPPSSQNYPHQIPF